MDELLHRAIEIVLSQADALDIVLFAVLWFIYREKRECEKSKEQISGDYLAFVISVKQFVKTGDDT